MFPLLIPLGAPSAPAVQTIDLSKTKVADADLADLKLFPGLLGLSLSDTAITDVGIDTWPV